MKINEVPQDCGIIGCHGREVCYAVNDKGRYELVPSLGWEVKNIVNDQAWDVILQEVRSILDLVRKGRLSPLAFHMAKNQMDPGLLARYSGMARWRVKRHLKPAVFRGLSRSVLSRYATTLGLSIDALASVPETLTRETLQVR